MLERWMNFGYHIDRRKFYSRIVSQVGTVKSIHQSQYLLGLAVLVGTPNKYCDWWIDFTVAALAWKLLEYRHSEGVIGRDGR